MVNRIFVNRLAFVDQYGNKIEDRFNAQNDFVEVNAVFKQLVIRVSVVTKGSIREPNY